MNEKLIMLYRIEGGELDGTEIIPILGMYRVKYPNRKAWDLYVPPLEGKSKMFHCCRTNCKHPDFIPTKMIEHLKLHAGKLIKKKEANSEQTKSRIH